MEALSRDFIEYLAEQHLLHYYGTQTLPLKALDVRRFAEDYMKLDVRYCQLLYPESAQKIIGVTAYAETRLNLNPDNPDDFIRIDKDMVLLDNSLSDNKNLGRRNFTLAHECGHQAIYLLDPEFFSDKACCRTANGTYTLSRLFTENDWCEWQANTFASALLLPEYTLRYMLYLLGKNDPFSLYPCNRLLGKDYQLARELAAFFHVSLTAVILRLKKLNMTKECTFAEYLEQYKRCLLLSGR